MEGGAHMGSAARQRRIATAMALLALAVLLGSTLVGSVAIPLAEFPRALQSVLAGEPSGLAASLLDLRLGRAASAFAVGAALSLAGVMMQSLLRNPLADPYVLGISSGSAARCGLAIPWPKSSRMG